MSIIKAVKARQIIDSRAMPTVECDIKTQDGLFRASVPSGASTGSHEAWELRDHGSKYSGNGVEKAVNNINKKIAPKLKGKKINQEKIDQFLIELDGTKNKQKLGTNAILAISMAITRAGATSHKQELYEYIADLYGTKKCRIPIPAFNIINGGQHASNNLAIQEFRIKPTGKTFTEMLRKGCEIYHQLKQNLLHNYGKSAINVGDEGGFAPQIKTTEQALTAIKNAIIQTGHKAELGIDAAATSFWKDNKYYLDQKEYTTQKLLDYYQDLIKKYNLTTLEDPFHEDDFETTGILTAKTNIDIIGDDLLTTNPERIKKAIQQKSCNSLLLKINQIGTITEALNAAKLAQQAGWSIMTSHRSGETNDDFISHLAVGIASKYIKAGAPARGERVAKYNELLRIEEELT
ncbi:phosphopyruvate hydratase [Candidatus Woesearchaeota archaeon CG10_big_fil_rev_8_21_14_0_10_37_12]|nr:MAG: phosphopyruvate hydratase [Candidatus Woesearchaeota archaeon CG10_big_fil_rev_8_21_14_0_10_37_12]